MADETPVIDLKTRKPLERIDVDENTSVLQFVNMMKKYCKDEKVASVFMVTITEDRHVNWGMITKDEHDLLLAYATLDDLKKEILDGIFPELDVELEDE